MELPRIVYDDFYKFMTSIGIILFLVGWGIFSYGHQILKISLLSLWSFIAITIIGLIFSCYGIYNWKAKQKTVDEYDIKKLEQLGIDIELSKKELKGQIDTKIKNISNEEKIKLKNKVNNELEKIDKKNLILMEIRYLLEKKIRLLLEIIDVPNKEFRSLANSIELLRRSEMFDYNTIHLLKEVIHKCNKAIHGITVTQKEYDFAIEMGEKMLYLLEEEEIKIKK